MGRTSRTLSVLVCLLSLVLTPVFSQTQSATPTQAGNGGKDLAALDLQSLLDMKVITASKFSEKLSDAPGVISVVTKDELRRFGGITLAEVLDRVAGLSPTSSYFTDRSLVAVRGDQTKINGGHILILINGRPTREILEGGVISDLLESFPVSALERIEVIKGPGSVLYGSNAFSGVVNLITQKADGDRLILTGTGGDAGAVVTSGQAMFKRGDLSLFGAAQFHQRPDWATTYRVADFLLGDPLSTRNQVSVLDTTLRDRSRGIYLGANYRGISFMSSWTEWGAPSFVRGIVGNTRWRRGFGDLGYQAQASANWDMSFNLTYTRNTLSASGDAEIGRDSNDAVLEWTNFFTLGAKDRLTAGVLYDHIQGTETFFGVSPSLVIADGSRSGEGAYAQLDHQLLDSVKLVGGFQANKIGHLDLSAVPRGGIIWTPAAHFSVKGLYSQAFRAPSIDETLLNHPGLAGSPNLVPEKVATYDLGVSYQGKRIQASVNYFHSKETNSIVVETETPRWQYVNLGQATFRGVEFEGKYSFSKAFYLSGSMLYQTNEDGNHVNNITPLPNLGIKGGASYQGANGLTVSIFDIFQGPLDGYPITLNPRPSSYHLLSSQLRFDLSKYMGPHSKSGLAFVAHAENLANQQVWLPDWGGNTGDSMPVNRGRTVYFGLEVSLGKE